MACELINFCVLNPSEQAAWVQAIFSIIAIVVAIAVPFCMDRKRRKERVRENFQKSTRIALALMDEADALLAKVVTVQHELMDDSSYERLDAISESLGVPGQLLKLASRLHELDSAAGSHLQNAIVLVNRAKRGMVMEEIRMQVAGTDQDLDGELLRLPSLDYAKSLEDARTQLEIAPREIQKLFPGLSA